MLLLSFRRNFGSAIAFGPPRVKIGDGLEIGLAELARRVEGKRVLLLIHGYHNSVTDTMDAYGTVEAQLRDRGLVDESGQNPRAYELVIGVLWPGSWLVLGFWSAWFRAKRAGRQLAELVRSWEPAAVDVETHSLGARVALEAAASLAPFRNLFLTAPAVHDDVLDVATARRPGGRFVSAARRARAVVVMFSETDMVLGLVYYMAMQRRPLGWKGPRGKCPPTVEAHDCTAAASGHGSYKASWLVYDIWAEALERTAR